MSVLIAVFSEPAVEVSPLATVSMTAEEETPRSASALALEGEAEVENKEEENDLVEMYSDRLCAVMHAFALCCTTMQSSNGRQASKHSNIA